MTTGYEVEYYQHIRNIDHHLNRIANCMEANEKRAREMPPIEDDPDPYDPEHDRCGQGDCRTMAVVEINGQGYCKAHLDEAFQQAKENLTTLHAVIKRDE